DLRAGIADCPDAERVAQCSPLPRVLSVLSVELVLHLGQHGVGCCAVLDDLRVLADGRVLGLPVRERLGDPGAQVATAHRAASAVGGKSSGLGSSRTTVAPVTSVATHPSPSVYGLPSALRATSSAVT